MSHRSALLIGATGLAGGHCLEKLLAEDRYGHVTALVRRPLDLPHAKLTQIEVDFDRIKEVAATVKGDDVFCCLGATIQKAGSKEAFYKVDFTYPAQIAKLSLANGAEQFLLVSALGANPRSLFFYNRVKGQVEKAIGELGFWGFHIFRPSLLLGERREARPGEEFGKKIAQWLAPGFRGPLRAYQPVAAAAVAQAMVKIALDKIPGTHVHASSRIQEIYRRGEV